jgi:hypothetical protein
MELEEKLKEFEHNFNPFHFYNMLREIGVLKEEAKRWAEIYEFGVYKNILEEIRKPKDI